MKLKRSQLLIESPVTFLIHLKSLSADNSFLIKSMYLLPGAAAPLPSTPTLQLQPCLASVLYVHRLKTVYT